MPFDHAKCPHCQTNLEPERLLQSERGPLCPKCQMPLRLVDLFGLQDQWAEPDDDGNNLTLDDLVDGSSARRGSAPEAEPKKPLTLENLLSGPTKRR